MKREIIFRGKDENGNWICGHYTTGYIHVDTSWKDGEQSEWWGIPIKEETISQFTGLLDKNGREIYEGDIVSAFSNINKISDPHLSTSDPTYSNKYVEFIRGVFSLSSLEFPNGGCGVLDHYVGAMSKDLEIIGNIHDNPSLLTNK